MTTQFEVEAIFERTANRQSELRDNLPGGILNLPAFITYYTLEELNLTIYDFLTSGDKVSLADIINTCVGGALASYEAFVELKASTIIDGLKKLPQKLSAETGLVESYESEHSTWWSYQDQDVLLYWRVHDTQNDKSTDIFLGKPNLKIPRELNPYNPDTGSLPTHQLFDGGSYTIFKINSRQIGRTPLTLSSEWTIQDITQHPDYPFLPKYENRDILSPKSWLNTLIDQLPEHISKLI